MNDATELAKLFAKRVKSAIDKALITINERIDGFQSRLKMLEDREPPKDGIDGANATEEQVREAVAAYLAANPPAPGLDGAPASAEMVQEAVAEHLRANPPINGKDGKDAEPISDEMIGKAVAGYLSIHPIRDGLAGRDGRDGKDGKDGEKGADGKDGVDGMGFDDLDIEFNLDSRTFTFKLQRGDYIKTLDVKAHGIPVQRGVYKRDKNYEHGDIVTWDGSQWFATKDTKLQPKVGNDWQLIVKRGNDGKDGKGEKGEPGLNGRDGRDLTHIAPDGSRY